MKAATYVPITGNRKTGPVAATYASIRSTCPPCPLRDNGCYAQGGHVAFTVRRLDRAGASTVEAAHAEARLVEAGPVYPATPLRLHVSGDASTIYAAQRLALAAAVYRRRRGGPVWTYTHAWRDVPRGAWGRSVSVLGSIENAADAAAVRAQGYAPALVVARFPNGARAFTREGVRYVPCPEQTRGVQCVRCRLCFDADALRDRGHGIAFAAHGRSAKRVRRRLPLI